MHSTPLPQTSAVKQSASPGKNASQAPSSLPFDDVLTQEVMERARQDVAAKKTEETQAPKDGAQTDDEKNAPVDASAQMLAYVNSINQLREGGNSLAEDGADLGNVVTGSKRRAAIRDLQSEFNPKLSKDGDADAELVDAGKAQNGRNGNLKADFAQALGQTQNNLPDLEAQLEGDDLVSSLRPNQQVLTPIANQINSQSGVSAAADKLSPPVGQQGWDQALGQKMVWMVKGEQQTASLTLNPPELGPLKIVLQLSSTQANATFIASQPEVRQALENAMPRLREMMEEAGIQLGQASVDSGSPHEQHASERAFSDNRNARDGSDENESSNIATGTKHIANTAGAGLVDTFA